jgi:hypothetical protein
VRSSSDRGKISASRNAAEGHPMPVVEEAGWAPQRSESGEEHKCLLSVFLRSVLQLLVTDNVVPSWLILSISCFFAVCFSC